MAVFLQGSKVDLRVPNVEDDVINGDWYAWFNDDEVTKYLHQGVYPNTRQNQINYVTSALDRKDWIMLAIIDKKTGEMCGVVTLKEIDLVNRVAFISIVMANKIYTPGAPFEAMALMTEYGFQKLNLNRIEAGQNEGLWQWINQLTLLGYKIEGFMRQPFIRYGKKQDAIRMAILSEEFYTILEARKGKYVTDDLIKLLKQRKTTNLIEEFKSLIGKFYDEHYN
ncbi:GNAT family N-acetyltransferase [Metabacillus arenae]|uniref:GNAT family N-acetyltransferase n=1 Tax=Metabacillus arenae TaxID=2771434 RepID=A0A926RZ66_9BACI|nr:GNAT family protein [Metabacillus arenae]MBD1381917.1 GNAT family N-acetyltransferase [Metabacillus arenae]